MKLIWLIVALWLSYYFTFKIITYVIKILKY